MYNSIVTLGPPLSRFSVKRFWIPSTPCTRYADFKLSNINPDSAILCAMKFVIYFPVTNWSNVFLSNSFKRSEHFFRRCISPSYKNGIVRLEAGAFKFLRNQLFMMSMQLPRKKTFRQAQSRKCRARYHDVTKTTCGIRQSNYLPCYCIVFP